MIKRLIKLNYKMISEDIIKSMVFLAVGSFFSLIFATWYVVSIAVSTGGLVVCVVYVFKGFNLVYNKSTFGDEAYMMMALPATSKETVISKIVLGIIWIVGLNALLIIELVIMTIPTHIGIEGLILGINSMWGPFEIKDDGILVIVMLLLMLIISFIVDTALLCSMIYAALFVGEKLKMDKNRWIMPIVFVAAWVLVGLGENYLMGSLNHVISWTSIMMTMVTIIVNLLLTVIFAKFCEKKLEINYDLK